MPQILTPELVLAACCQGLFPMADSRDASEIAWYSPDPRAILPLDARFHVPRSLKKFLRRSPFEIRYDTAFDAVIRACAEPTPSRPETWINEAIIECYTALWRQGFGHSVECWENGALVGGLYGLAIGKAFLGESMFSRRPNASKAALVALVTRLRSQHFQLLDIQFINPHLLPFGACEIPRERYLQHLNAALQ